MFEDLLARSGLSLDRLRSFLLVAEAGSISRAARDDVVRQSLYSRQIRELEAFFGTQLTERRGKGIAISAAGRRLAMLVRESLQSLEDFQREQAQGAKLFSIGAGASVLQWVAVPCLHEFAGHLGGARVRVESHRSVSAVHAVRDGKLDFAIVREDAVPADLPRAVLGKVTFMLCVPRALCRGMGADAVATKAVWPTLPLAALTTGGQFHSALQVACAEAGVPFQPAVECGSFLEVRALVAAGRHAGILPSIGIAGWAPPEVIVRPFPPLKSYGRSLCLHWNARQIIRRGLEDAGVKALAGTLRRAFKRAVAL